MYLVFLVILGMPVMVMEFAVGRASQRSAAQAFDKLQPSGHSGTGSRGVGYHRLHHAR